MRAVVANDGNSRNGLERWILGAVYALALAAALAFVNRIEQNFARYEGVIASRGERMARLEFYDEITSRQIVELRARLERLEVRDPTLR